MKKQFLSFAFATALIAIVAAGCSSQQAASGSDSTATVDSAGTMSTTTDTTARDTARRDTTKTNPPQ
ncbi:Vmc-like lipoprotein signal peptide domain-containing protein [Mucilaginibacter sp. PAMB04168]|uniref:Vmc-like lipoprotein signal peptide domain-containing protein n=1 Tax=Mucilaginibacter sp. PAMB04168 TaxID=3138567 RepID=UPI0031F7119A